MQPIQLQARYALALASMHYDELVLVSALLVAIKYKLCEGRK